MNLTFDEAIENHRKMWNWIADKTEKRKEVVEKIDYFIENKLNRPYCNCYCCKYADENSKTANRDCEICPINWGLGRYCFDDRTAFDKRKCCKDSDDWQSTAKYAREIANLPAREEVRNNV